MQYGWNCGVGWAIGGVGRLFFCLIILAFSLARLWRRTFYPFSPSAVRPVAARCKLPFCSPPRPVPEESRCAPKRITKEIVRYINRPTRPAAEACLDRCVQMRARKASVGAGGQWPPATSRPGGGKLPPKDLDEPVMGNGLDVHVYIESGPPVSVKRLSNGIPTYR